MMTGQRIGTGGMIRARLVECEQAVTQLAAGGVPGAKEVTRLRTRLGGPLADLVLSVAALQDKARAKLGPLSGNSRIWWVTEKSLQQSTAWQVARLKSNWIPDGLVYDLCCGIGGDAVHLARRHQLVAVDSEPLTAEMAALNLAGCDLPAAAARVCCSDAAAIQIPSHAAIHIDPDRRAGGDRSASPMNSNPAWPEVLEVIANSNNAIVKLAPAAEVQTAGLGPTHRCWISLRGSVREQSLLCGEVVEHAGLASDGRSAVSLGSDGSALRFAPHADSDDADAARTDIPAGELPVLIDPDASIRAAGLTTAFAGQYGLRLLGGPSGFLTCSDPPSPASLVTRMAVVGTVIWHGSCDDRVLRRELRRRGLFPVAVKVRGTKHHPADLVRRYRRCGEKPVVLWIGRTNDRVFAAITK